MVDDRAFADLAGRVYEAALDPDGGAILGSAQRQVAGVDSGLLYICEARTGRMLHLVSASPNFDAAARADYAAHYHGLNPWFGRALLETRRPFVAPGEALTDPETFATSEFANDWCRRVGIWHMMGATFELAPGIVMGAGAHRSLAKGAFEPDEVRAYGRFCAHLARALSLTWRLGLAEERASVADAERRGRVLLDVEARPVLVDDIARRLLDDQRWLTLRDGRLTPSASGHRDEFAKCVSHAAKAADAKDAYLPLIDRRNVRLLVRIAPHRSDASGLLTSRGRVLVSFDAPGAEFEYDIVHIAAAFGLSAAEARVAASLAHGRTLADHAAREGISRNTVRTLLSRAFVKTGTSRQAELAALVARHIGPMH